MSQYQYRLSKQITSDTKAGTKSQSGKTRVQIKQAIVDAESSRKLNLGDLLIGDEYVSDVANLLQTNKQIEQIDLRGNNLSPEGLAALIDALDGNERIATLNLEWNNIGLGLAGLDALAGFLRRNKSLQSIDLRNNKLTVSAAQSIAQMVRDTKSLITLDLRWNELGNATGRAIASALKQNSTLINIELAGNGISEDIIRDINALLEQNRSNQALRKPSGTTQYQNFENERDQGMRSKGQSGGPEYEEVLLDLRKALSANAELERLLGVESRRNEDLREKYIRDLEEERRRFAKQRDEDSRLARELQAKIENYVSENAMLKKDTEALAEKVRNLESLHEKDIKQIQELDFALKNQEAAIVNNDEFYKTNIDKVVNEGRTKLLDAETKWEAKHNELFIDNQKLAELNNNLEAEIKRLQEEIRRSNILKDDEIRNAAIRARDEEHHKNLLQIKQLEATIYNKDEKIRALELEAQDRSKEFQLKEQRLLDQLAHSDEEIRRLKHEVNLELDDLNKAKMKAESLVNELLTKEHSVLKLEGENGHLRKEIEEERRRRDELRYTLQDRINDLENQLRTSQGELHRVRQELQRLSDLLISNITKTVYNTVATISTK